MSDSNSKVSSSTSGRTSKRLLFDRRYGWVFDEWKDPTEEALAGGRGMFCILPLATTLFDVASQSINLVGRSTVEVFKRPELLSPQVLQSNVNDQLHKFVSSIQKPEFNLFPQKISHPTACLSHPNTESSESQID
ncbi:uncharacterized protein LOC130754004 [Actinidia eriantha]|uniref:uncharacterized protein LOC130754004 n=1 Tax=Actinidia eriantha TaxID=165200 RepID=UPI00258B20F0|nr:uncharacterized protein LOC130754004 [Actinidia eriantha]